MSGLSRGMPADRKEAVLVAADTAEYGIQEIIAAIRRYQFEENHDMARWVSETYAVLCAVDCYFMESKWTT